MAAYHSIPQMNWCESDLAEQMTLFKQTMNLYLDDEDITENERKARKILRGIGSEELKRLNASALSDEDLKTPSKIWIFLRIAKYKYTLWDS